MEHSGFIPNRVRLLKSLGGGINKRSIQQDAASESNVGGSSPLFQFPSYFSKKNSIFVTMDEHPGQSVQKHEGYWTLVQEE